MAAVPDPETNIFEEPEAPGLLEAEWAPICDVLPTTLHLSTSSSMSQEQINSRLSHLKTRCNVKANELSFCVNLSVLSEKGLVPFMISDALERIRQNCPASNHHIIPFFGLEFDTNDKFLTDGASVSITEANTYGDCLLRCANYPSPEVCNAFLFKNQRECVLCHGNCFRTSLCGRRSDCSGGQMQKEKNDSTKFERPKFMLLPLNVEVKGDVIASTGFVHPVLAIEWCKDMAFGFSVVAESTSLESTPRESKNVFESFQQLPKFLTGPFSGVRCMKFCSKYRSSDYVLSLRFPTKENLSHSLLFEKYGAEFAGHCINESYDYTRNLPHTYYLSYHCECFADQSVRSIQAESRSLCRKINVPGSTRLFDTCRDMVLKAMGSHGMKEFS